MNDYMASHARLVRHGQSWQAGVRMMETRFDLDMYFSIWNIVNKTQREKIFAHLYEVAQKAGMIEEIKGEDGFSLTKEFIDKFHEHLGGSNGVHYDAARKTLDEFLAGHGRATKSLMMTALIDLTFQDLDEEDYDRIRGMDDGMRPLDCCKEIFGEEYESN